MKYILAIDQSTSGTKALLFELTGAAVASASVGHQQHYPRPGWVEHDAEELYRNTIAALRELLDQRPTSHEDILCLSIANQRETIVVFDKSTGRPLRNAIVWQCRRGDPICAELEAAGHGPEVKRITGLKIDTYFSASKLKWLFENEPDVKAAVKSGEALIGTIDTYLIYRLTGGRVFATDHTNASRTLLFDIRELQFSDTLCELFGVPVEALPESRDCSAQFGETTLDGLLEESIPICGVIGDSQGALFAQRCFEPGSAKVTFGTGSSVLLNVGDEPRLSEQGIVTTVAWVHEGRPTYAFEGIINCQGATVQWLKEQLGMLDDVAASEALATSVPDNGGVYLVPAFAGLSAPHWSHDARAAIVGLSLQSNKKHVARAALEAIGYQVKDVLDVMAAEAGVTLQYVNADGGIVRNRFLMQFVADITGLAVRPATLPELSALGGTLLGALGMGAYGSLADLEQLELGFSEYTPAMDPELVEKNCSGWRAAVNRVL